MGNGAKLSLSSMSNKRLTGRAGPATSPLRRWSLSEEKDVVLDTDFPGPE